MKEEETSEEVVAGKIMVQSKPVVALFDSSASHCFITNSFTALHYIPLVCLDNLWEISTENEVVTSNKVCKD